MKDRGYVRHHDFYLLGSWCQGVKLTDMVDKQTNMQKVSHNRKSARSNIHAEHYLFRYGWYVLFVIVVNQAREGCGRA